MPVKKYFIIFIILTIFLIVPVTLHAQCPMCRASVESSIKGGKSKAGTGLNTGILYLLAAPYLAVAGLGFFWYKKYRRKSDNLDIKDDKIILN